MSSPDDPPPPDGKAVTPAEPVEARDPQRLAHLAQNRGLIVRRSLLATALGGFIPLPVMDDFVAGRVRAGLYIKLAESRHVDLPQPAADLLADPREGSALRNATLTAATLVALKLAWRKFFAVLAAGRGAEEMATTFQFATLVDHYCARLHVGGGVTRTRAAELRALMHASIDRTEKSALVAVFRDGGKVLGRSVLEAPRWVTERIGSYAQRWAQTRGAPPGSAPFDPGVELPGAPGESRWIDRAARVVEERLGGVGHDYLSVLLDRFEDRWRARPPESDPGAPTGSGTPGSGTPGSGTPGSGTPENGAPPRPPS
jgi:hypothetical protein